VICHLQERAGAESSVLFASLFTWFCTIKPRVDQKIPRAAHCARIVAALVNRGTAYPLLIDPYQSPAVAFPLLWFDFAFKIGVMQKTSDIIWQDTQHQVLFELIDQIKEVPFDPDILLRLKLYAEHHFILEETYMATLDYPHAAPHIEAHNRFREELAAMIDTDPSVHLALQESLSDFLYKWLKLHVLGIDKKLEDFVLKSSSK